MTKITFIGGGSVQWVPDLLSDIALTPALSGTQIVLQDINFSSLERMLPVARRIIKHHGADIEVNVELDRAAALRQADFVVLCVSIGGLEAMRNDLEIPLKYGIHQSVGDTVGPGGLARALRHIPFAVHLAKEMEMYCPHAWLLNLTNPMTVICRAVSKATSIRVIGLCHELAGVRQHLADLFNAPLDQVVLTAAGINHLPVIVGCSIGGKDGIALLQDYLAQHDPLSGVDHRELNSPYQVFHDQLALKFSLFKQTGVLYGAGDRHVAEFFPAFLTDATQNGQLYGIHLTTVDQRLEMLHSNQDALADYISPRQISTEQLAPLVAALTGGPAGRFVLNIPNQGQIDNLPRQAVVECMAFVDQSGLWPLAVGDLPPAAHAVVNGHVDRQELIVEAAFSGNMDLGYSALVSDPLVQHRQDARALFDELLQANQRVMARLASAPPPDTAVLATAVAGLNTQSVEACSAPVPVGYSVDYTPIRQLMEDEASRSVLQKHFGGLLQHPQLKMAYDMTFKAVARYAPLILTRKKLLALDKDLRALHKP